MGANISDPEKINTVLNALDVSAHSMAVKLGYKSHASVYHVINGINTLSDGMIERIVKQYPNVNYNFLKKGQLPVLLSPNEIQAQMNIFNIPSNETTEFFKIKRLMEIPERLDLIEEMLQELLGKKSEE